MWHLIVAALDVDLFAKHSFRGREARGPCPRLPPISPDVLERNRSGNYTDVHETLSRGVSHTLLHPFTPGPSCVGLITVQVVSSEARLAELLELLIRNHIVLYNFRLLFVRLLLFACCRSSFTTHKTKTFFATMATTSHLSAATSSDGLLQGAHFPHCEMYNDQLKYWEPLGKVGYLLEAASADAASLNCTAAGYIKGLRETYAEFLNSENIADRSELKSFLLST